jgi:ApbE superfamily uncharacterized protein (UPF0280 family)
MSAAAAWLPGERLHLQHGPIDVIAKAEGASAAAAMEAARARFATVLAELVEELPRLRDPDPHAPPPAGPTARRMASAVRPHQRRGFMTPMAAVAGAVADEILAAMTAAGPLTRGYANNGGDIALHLAPGQRFEVAMAGCGTLRVAADDGVGGVATSGAGGRSLSLGIADAATVLAANGAAADAAATAIANAVDVPGHPAIRRAPADDLRDDSDLGARLATVSVGALEADEVDAALDRGAALAGALLSAGEIAGAALFLRGRARLIGAAALHDARTESLEHA